MSFEAEQRRFRVKAMEAEDVLRATHPSGACRVGFFSIGDIPSWPTAVPREFLE